MVLFKTGNTKEWNQNYRYANNWENFEESKLEVAWADSENETEEKKESTCAVACVRKREKEKKKEKRECESESCEWGSARLEAEQKKKSVL